MNISLDRNTPPVAQPLSKVSLPPYATHKLSNGIPVYLLQHGSVSVVEVQAIFKAGNGYQDKVGQSQFTAQNLKEGTAHYSSLDLAQQLDGLGAWISNDSEESYVALNLATTTANLTKSLPLLKEVITHPTFPEDEFEKMKQRTLQKLSVSEKKTAYLARRQFRHLMFGNTHTYGVHFGKPELLKLERQDLLDYHEAYLYPGNFSLSVVGKFDPQETLEVLESIFGQLPTRPAINSTSAALLPTPESATGRHYFEQEGMQATVRLGHVGFDRSHPDYYGMVVVNTILGGYFGSRLMKNIREDKGYTYGIYSGWLAYRYGGMFVIQADVGNEYIEPTITEIKSEMHKLIADGVQEDELSLVKNYLLGRNISQRETPFQLGDIVRYSITHDISFEEIDRKFEVIQAITTAEVQALAQQYLQPDNMLEVVVGKMP